jgi:hypothetical protein
MIPAALQKRRIRKIEEFRSQIEKLAERDRKVMEKLAGEEGDELDSTHFRISPSEALVSSAEAIFTHASLAETSIVFPKQAIIANPRRNAVLRFASQNGCSRTV